MKFPLLFLFTSCVHIDINVTESSLYGQIPLFSFAPLQNCCYVASFVQAILFVTDSAT